MLLAKENINHGVRDSVSPPDFSLKHAAIIAFPVMS
jgi:hypothetical protein